jgi:hypothetical protein
LAEDPVRGLVRCNTFVITGSATVYGGNFTFHDFQRDDKLYDRKSAQASESIETSLFAALHRLLDGNGSSNIIVSQATNAWSFTLVADKNHSMLHISPSIDEVLWRGTRHIAAALAILATDDIAYPAVDHVAASRRKRNLPAFIGAMVLLALWSLSMVGLTAAFWREMSLGNGFDSYVAGRLLAIRVGLVDSDCLGGLEENKRLMESLRRGDHWHTGKCLVRLCDVYQNWFALYRLGYKHDVHVTL